MAHVRSYVGMRDCAICGTPFRLRADAAKNKTRGKYCSTDCSNRGRSLPLVADVADLKRLYLDEKKTTREIAEMYGSTWKHVSRTLKHMGVKLRIGREARGHKRSRMYRTIAQAREGRLLRSNEVVHHIDCNWRNNNPANLVVVLRRKHAGLHKQLENISVQLFVAGLITFDHQAGYQMTDNLKALVN